MDQNQAAQRREAVVLHSQTDMKKRYEGEQVYSISQLGIVIAVGQLRLFFPWTRVCIFNYHHEDEQARKVIQGW